MAKETLSFKIEKDHREALEKEAKKKEWTLSYYVQSIVNQYIKRNKLV
jgi:predicted DNA-binding protein